MRARSLAGRPALAGAAAALALAVALGCGSAPARGRAESAPDCPDAVLDTLESVERRIYHEGINSERSVVARRLIAGDQALSAAVQAGDARATRAALQALLASGHVSNLRVARGARVLAAGGGGPALAPLRGTIAGARGAAVGSYVASVWSDEGFIEETTGLARMAVALRQHEHSIGGSLALPPGRLPPRGTLSFRHAAYRYTSFGANSYPSGRALRVYLLEPLRAASAFCGRSSQDTLVNTLGSVARRLYAGEAGARTRPQVTRVQRDRVLLRAVARRDPAAARAAVTRLLHQHLVRLRVSAGGRLLADVGGPYVLAPVSAPLRSGGRTIGSLVLSIQDDEGYLRLAKRLAGIDVLMYMGRQLVKNSLGPAPGAVPPSGSYSYRGHSFRVLTLHGQAFPAGPLRISVLIPIPYS